MQLDEFVDILAEVEHRFSAAIKLRFLDRVIHDFSDDDARRRWRVGVHTIKPTKREERFLKRILADDPGVSGPRNRHLAGCRLAKRELIAALAERFHGLGRLAVDEQVGCVDTAHRHAELDLHRLERLHRQSSGRVGPFHVRRVVIRVRVCPAVAGGQRLERVRLECLIDDPVILHPRELYLAVRHCTEIKHP